VEDEVFPVRIDDAVMETPEPWARKLRDQRNVGDFRRWKDHDAELRARGARSDEAKGSIIEIMRTAPAMSQCQPRR
jgi:hypothetical protein